MPLDPFLSGPMPGKDAAMGEIRLTISGQFGPIIDLPLMAATARAEATNGVVFTFEYHRPCPHDEDDPCTCSPDVHMAALRLQVLDAAGDGHGLDVPPAPAVADEHRPAAETVRLQINAGGGVVKINDLHITTLPPECRPPRSVIMRVGLAEIWQAVGNELAAYITGRPAEPEPRSGYCIDERCGRNGLHPEHS